MVRAGVEAKASAEASVPTATDVGLEKGSHDNLYSSKLLFF